ncbi:MAG: hypothetical protein GKR91_10255 [Pseudomonadales bacterium]|nr:hypothetical protein [Pseudomonadales bacterium]
MLIGSNLDLLTTVMQTEWLVIGSGLMFMPFILIPVASRVGNHIRAVLCLLLTLTFAYGAYSMNGWTGVLSFYILLIMGYGGSVLFVADLNKKSLLAIEFLIRWIVCLVIFFSLFVYFDPPRNIENWLGNTELLPYGAVFFSCLFVLELSLYSWSFNKINRIVFSSNNIHRNEDPEAGKIRLARQRFYDAIRRK